MSSPEPSRRLGVLVVVLLAAAAACGHDSTESRQQQLARRGAQVMPFDLDATTHWFIKTDDGGIQRVQADDPSDATQIALVRRHLHEEQDKFQRGDYDDPARIHGMDMPGVAELAAGHDRITVSYTDRPAGAELRYRTSDAELISAVHEWFDRQVMDHGDDARAG